MGAGVQGIDVSHYQGTIDWGLVAEAGKVFTFIKATEGTSEVDPQFQANWSGANAAAGLLRGAYHFYQPGADPHQQAESFLSVVQPGPEICRRLSTSRRPASPARSSQESRCGSPRSNRRPAELRSSIRIQASGRVSEPELPVSAASRYGLRNME